MRAPLFMSLDSYMPATRDAEKDLQEFLKNFLLLPIQGYWIGRVVVTMVVTIIVVIGLAAFFLLSC